MGSDADEADHFEQRARARQRRLLKPPGSLGRLEELAVRMAAFQRTERPASRPAAAVVFVSDHPVAARGVSAYPQSVTAAMMPAFASGRAASCVLATSLGVPLRVVDVGVSHPYRLPERRVHSVSRHPVAGAEVGDVSVEDAMSGSVADAARQAGEDVVDRLDDGIRVVVLGEMGIGNTTPASALAAHLLGESAEGMVGRGTGVDAAGLSRKRAAVRAALARAAGCSADAALRILGGRDLAALCGAIQRAHATGRIILVDGFVVTAAALWAIADRPAVRDACVFSHRSVEPGHGRMLERLDAVPLLDLELRLGEATGALTALPLLDLACALHARMWTFEEAGASGESGGG